MTKTLTIIYQASHHHRERIFVMLVGAILLTAFAYAFLLQKAIVNVVQREKVAKEVKAASARLGVLEEKYFSLKNTVTLDLAHAKGLRSAEKVSYISKKSLTAMASHNDL